MPQEKRPYPPSDTETRVGYTRTSSEAGEQRGLTHDAIVAGIALGASGATDVAKPTLTAVGEAIRDKIVPNAKGDDPKK